MNDIIQNIPRSLFLFYRNQLMNSDERNKSVRIKMKVCWRMLYVVQNLILPPTMLHFKLKVCDDKHYNGDRKFEKFTTTF